MNMWYLTLGTGKPESLGSLRLMAGMLWVGVGDWGSKLWTWMPATRSYIHLDPIPSVSWETAAMGKALRMRSLIVLSWQSTTVGSPYSNLHMGSIRGSSLWRSHLHTCFFLGGLTLVLSWFLLSISCSFIEYSWFLYSMLSRGYCHLGNKFCRLKLHNRNWYMRLLSGPGLCVFGRRDLQSCAAD